jgi:hypothetical protein
MRARRRVGPRQSAGRVWRWPVCTGAYLLAKIAVYGLAAVIQSAILVPIVICGNGAPTQGAVMLPTATVELFVDIAATCVASALLGLALSALARSHGQIMPLLVVAVMAQLVFSGGMIPVPGRLLLDPLSWLTPARWGFAASAATVDLTSLVPADPEGLTLVEHPGGLAVRHGHARCAQPVLHRVGAMENPDQRRADRVPIPRPGPAAAVASRGRQR